MKKYLPAVAACFIFYSVYGQGYPVRGTVYSAELNKPLPNAKVVLKHAETKKELGNKTTGQKGDYSIVLSAPEAFIVEVSLEGYQHYSSSKFYFAEFQNSYAVEKISLIKSSNPVTVTKVKVDTLPAKQVIEKKFSALEILPTNGAYELFYLLNPALRSNELIPENRVIVYPKFPDFDSHRKGFNRQFKKDKRKGEPFISQINFLDPEAGGHTATLNKDLITGWQPVASALPERSGYSFEEPVIFNGAVAGKPKKFVFVMWKKGRDGKPITEGPEVAGKYKVLYYLGRHRGDTTAYNKSSNATYGYAPMNDAKYYIEVYDQDTGKRVRVSDDEIDAHKYFEQQDLFVMLNIVYMKIVIQVFE